MDNTPTIDKLSPVPLYHQLRSILEHQIELGVYKPGDDLPGENELCAMYGVSRTTTRQTIREMIADGVLFRKESRGRPIVAPTVVRQSLLRLQGFFTDDMLTSGLWPQTTVIACDSSPFPSVAGLLKVPADQQFFRVERLHKGGGEPLALQVSYVPQKVCPNLNQQDLSQSLFTYIEQTYGKRIVKARQFIRIAASTKQDRQKMQLPQRVPLFKIERVSYAEDGEPVEYFVCYLRSDRYELEMELDSEMINLARGHQDEGVPTQ